MTVWLLWKRTTLYGSTHTICEVRRPFTGPGESGDDDGPKFERVYERVPVSTEALVGVYCEDPLAGREGVHGYRSEEIEVKEPARAYPGDGI